jgi:branched-chain amino acid transport system permease protein
VNRRRLTLIAVALAAAYALPYRLSAYPMQVADVAIIFALLAIGLHLTLGIAGQINLAQVAFFGVSAYATAILTTHYGLGFWSPTAVSPAAPTAYPASRPRRSLAWTCPATTSTTTSRRWS